jgi:hypothetical protein
VAEAKPGDTDFNGGRWAVMPVTWHVTPYQLTSAEEVFAAETAVCSVSPIPPAH